jgi:hypothetical protein
MLQRLAPLADGEQARVAGHSVDDYGRLQRSMDVRCGA